MNFEIGSCIYRFTLDCSTNPVTIIRHTFQVVEIISKTETYYLKDRYRFRCLEDPTLKFRDGYSVSLDDSDFNKIRMYGNRMYVLLTSDNAQEALEIAGKYLKDKRNALSKNLLDIETKCSKFEAFYIDF